MSPLPNVPNLEGERMLKEGSFSTDGLKVCKTQLSTASHNQSPLFHPQATLWGKYGSEKSKCIDLTDQKGIRLSHASQPGPELCPVPGTVLPTEAPFCLLPAWSAWSTGHLSAFISIPHIYK